MSEDTKIDEVEQNEPVLQETQVEPTLVENKKTNEEKNKRNPFARFLLTLLKAILWILLALVILIAGWMTFSAFNKKNIISLMPNDFSVYVRAESVWETIEPLMDLEAADILLSEPSLAGLRGAFMKVRSMDLHKNPIIGFLGKRELNAGVYIGEDKSYKFVGVLELGVLSSVTRLAPFANGFINIENLSYDEQGKYFMFKAGDNLNVYIKPDHNLAVVSTDYDLFLRSISGENQYSAGDKTVLTKKDDEKVKVFLDTEKLVALYETDQAIVEKLSEILDYETFSKVALNLTDKTINVKITLPFKDSMETVEKYPVLRSSTVPGLISKYPETVQYYTMINISSLEDLKTTIFPFVPEKYNIESLWTTGNGLAKSLLGVTLEELLFSWTGSELAAFGIEGRNDPVFALQIKDEKLRRQVFDKALDSLLMKDDASLILDGVRIPRIMLPSYIQNILDVFGINLQTPYYMVENGYVFFSASAECLSNLHRSSKYVSALTKNEYYSNVAKNMENNVLLSLYYNLDRAVPFFIRKNAKISRVLELYSLGRCDFSIRNGDIVVNLQANSENAVKLRDVPGFPLELEGKNDGYLYGENTKNPGALYWVSGGNTVMSMEVPSMKVSSLVMNEKTTLVSVGKPEKNGGTVWAVTESGSVYLFDKKLALSDGFPVVTECSIVDKPVAYEDKVVFCTETGTLCMVDLKGDIRKVRIPVSNGILSKPSLLASEKIFAVYDKGFIGKIFTVSEDDFDLWLPEMEDEGFVASVAAVGVSGIGFGSPAMLKSKGSIYTGFVTQAGYFHLWKDGEGVEDSPIKLEGVYNTNAVALNGKFYMLSEEGMLSCVSLDGSVIEVQVPYGKAKSPFISVIDGNLYICADSNTIYGFTPELELLYGFPVTGWGVPFYADVNGDNKKDCFALGLDGNMNCWNLN